MAQPHSILGQLLEVNRAKDTWAFHYKCIHPFRNSTHVFNGLLKQDQTTCFYQSFVGLGMTEDAKMQPTDSSTSRTGSVGMGGGVGALWGGALLLNRIWDPVCFRCVNLRFSAPPLILLLHFQYIHEPFVLFAWWALPMTDFRIDGLLRESDIRCECHGLPSGAD